MSSSLYLAEDQNPFALYNLENTFCKGSYMGMSFDEHCGKVLEGFELTDHGSESMHEFYYQEIKELCRLNEVNGAIYNLSHKNQCTLVQIILKHSRKSTPRIQIHR